jgi:hypothetical protein
MSGSANRGESGGTYVDQVRVVYRSIDHPSKPTLRGTVVLIADAGFEIDRVRLLDEIHQLHETPTDLGGVRHDNFQSEERLRTHSWGASGAILEILMWVSTAAVSGIVGNVAYDRLKSVGDRLRGLHGPDKMADPLNAQNAQQRAKQMTQAAWPEVDQNGLVVLSCNLVADTATVVMRASDGSIITAVPSLTGAGAIGPITRAYPDEP